MPKINWPRVGAHLQNGWIWFHALLAAILGGAAATLGAHLIDPSNIDFSVAGLEKMKTVAMGGALMAIVLRLTHSPLSSTPPVPKEPASNDLVIK